MALMHGRTKLTNIKIRERISHTQRGSCSNTSLASPSRIEEGSGHALGEKRKSPECGKHSGYFCHFESREQNAIPDGVTAKYVVSLSPHRRKYARGAGSPI